MPTNESKKKYDIQYAKDKLKRIPLDVKKEKYEEIKAAADAVGEPVNRYIKKAVDERMEREKDSTITEKPIMHHLGYAAVYMHNIPELETSATAAMSAPPNPMPSR